MRATYSIHVEPWGFLRFRLAGLFDQETFARFAAERRLAFVRLTCAPNAHLTLVDLNDFLLQPRLLADAFQQFVLAPDTRSRRMALICGTSAARLQVRRLIASRDDIRLFADEASAMAWLMESGAQAA
jgi:PhoPQ-activated pathogenicity-related protein